MVSEVFRVNEFISDVILMNFPNFDQDSALPEIQDGRHCSLCVKISLIWLYIILKRWILAF